mmetsp:Transcript_20184/g.44766  ORF Transcript_20184/g.44766 Transcript_20184/m.44766 type:complete len:439 (+) Transcript_20184:87-1403(+)
MQSLTSLLSHLETNRDSPTISLAYASVGDDGMAEVSRFVRDNSFVKYLDLRGNNIGAKGAVTLSNGLKLNRSLRSLNLKWNQIGRDNTGVQALCEMLRTNVTISHVDFRNNRINNVGATYIGEMLRENTTITHLDVSWNDLGVDGGLALLEGLKHNSTLVDCQLSGSKVGEEALHEVAFLLRRNRAAATYKVAGAGNTGSPVPQIALQSSSEVLAPKTPREPAFRPPDQIKSVSDRAPSARSAAPAASVAVVPGAARSRTDNNILLKLMQKERETVLPEDKAFYSEVAEYIDRIHMESMRHKQGRVDSEERERLSTGGFVEREMRYTKEIRSLEEGLQRTVADKEQLTKEIALLTGELKRLNDESAMAVRESVAFQEAAHSQEEQLRQELRDIMTEKRGLQDQLAVSKKDLEMLGQENTRLRVHVKSFQRDVSEILVT